MNKLLQLSSRQYSTIFRSSLPDVHVPKISYPKYILDHVAKTKGKALICSRTGRTITYPQLLEGVKAVSSALVKTGFKKKDVLCIYTPNCLEYPFAILGAMSAGGIVSTANPGYTTEELQYQLKDSGAKYLLTNKANFETAAAAAKRVKSVKDIFITNENINGTRNFTSLLEDDGQADPSSQWKENPEETVAGLLYSSGTTGLSKGVMLTHYNLVGNMSQCKPLSTDIEESNEVLCGILPFFHVYGQVPVLAFTLTTKNKIVIHEKFDPVDFLEAIQKYKMTTLHIVPPILLFLLHHPMVEKYDLSSIRNIVCAAAPLKPETEKQFNLKFPNINLSQGYGLTEMSPVISIAPPLAQRKAGKPGNCGVLIPNQHVKIIDPENNQSLGVGERGEIVIKGLNVMKGYLNNKTATDSSIKDGWFYTGDIGYFDEDGYLYIVDRLKELIKVKGLQVAPAELEGLLLDHPDIQDAAVIGKHDDKSGEVPLAFVVLKKDKPENAQDIYNWLSQKVSKHKNLDGGIIFTDAIPKAASGKILRRILREKIKTLK